jgi:hypothetical protein
VKKKDQNTKKKLQNIMDYNKSTSRCGGIVFFHIPLGVFAFVEASHFKKKMIFFKLIFLYIFLHCFDVLILKINFKK